MQHVILRKDLTKAPFSWPAGSMIAQGCHVVSKTLWELKEEPNVLTYMADIDNMHKVTLMATDEAELRNESNSRSLFLVYFPCVLVSFDTDAYLRAVIAALTENGIHFRRCRWERRMLSAQRAASRTLPRM